MSENIYAAPLSNLDERSATDTGARFYVVSTRKLLVLYFMTIGLYHLYWNYKNWALHNRATGEGVWPVPRALFSIFFTHSLFREVASHDVTHKRAEWNAGSYATFMVLLVIGGNILERMASKGLGSPMTDIASIALLVPTGLLLKRIQEEVNARCGDPAAGSNASFTAANIAWCVAGAAYWTLGILGIFFTD
ncbi:hypothetical protein [Pseudoduganella sp. HUAS MS19]